MTDFTVCLAFLLQLQGADVASLGMDGKWYIPDWNKVAEVESDQSFATNPANGTGKDQCYGRELRLHRDHLQITEHLDTACPEDINGKMQIILSSDPVIQACS